MATNPDSMKTRGTLDVGGVRYAMHRLDALGDRVTRLPFSLRVLLENLLRREDGRSVTADHIAAILEWDAKKQPEREIPFMPARVILQDFTGVPCVVDLAAMRDAMASMGGDPRRINPLQPVDLVIDHSVQVDRFGTPQAFQQNVELEYQRNRERYAFLRWGQRAFSDFRVVPPGTGIVHQVNLEYLAPVVVSRGSNGQAMVFPDTVLGTDSHTTMINGLGVVGWGVGGIEAEAAMLGQATVMLVPQVIGFRLHGTLAAGATATDLVLTVTEMLRKKGVVGKFVEFYGPGLDSLALADRATIANMAPEYGATIGFFPIDDETLAYLRLSGRDDKQVALVEAYAKAQGIFRTAATPEPEFTDTLELDLGSVEPSLAGPKRPQDRVPLRTAKAAWEASLADYLKAKPGDAAASRAGRDGGPARRAEARLRRDRRHHELHQHVEPVGDAGRRPRRQQGGGARPAREAVGEDQPRARLEGGDALPGGRRRCSTTSPRSASIWWATAAPPASATRDRCPSRWRRPSSRATWWPRRCCRATATSRAA